LDRAALHVAQILSSRRFGGGALVEWSFAHGEYRAKRVRNDLVGGGAFEMRRGAVAAAGIADAENNQIGRAIVGYCKNPLCRVSIFRKRLEREVELRILQDDRDSCV
jgi:hypothetical protein